MNISIKELREDRDRWQAIVVTERSRVESAHSELMHAQADFEDAQGMVARLESLLVRREASEPTESIILAPAVANEEDEDRPVQTGPSVRGRLADLLMTLWDRSRGEWKTAQVYEAMRKRDHMTTGARNEEAALRPVIHRGIKSGYLERPRSGVYRLTPAGRLVAEQLVNRALGTAEGERA